MREGSQTELVRRKAGYRRVRDQLFGGVRLVGRGGRTGVLSAHVYPDPGFIREE